MVAPVTSLSKDKIRILLLEGIHASAVDNLARAGYQNVEQLKGALDRDTLLEKVSQAHMVGIRSRTQLDAEVLKAARRLMAIGCFCIGTNQVDLKAALNLGIPVFNAPFSNTRSVAELVLAEAILLLRGIPEKSLTAHEGGWLKSATDSFDQKPGSSKDMNQKLDSMLDAQGILGSIGIMNIAMEDKGSSLMSRSIIIRGLINELYEEGTITSKEKDLFND